MFSILRRAYYIALNFCSCKLDKSIDCVDYCQNSITELTYLLIFQILVYVNFKLSQHLWVPCLLKKQILLHLSDDIKKQNKMVAWNPPRSMWRPRWCEHTFAMLWIPPRLGFPINTPTDDASTLSRYQHGEWSTSTSNLDLTTPHGPLHSCCLIVRVFIRINKCILRVLLSSLECSFKHRGLTSSGVLGQPQAWPHLFQIRSTFLQDGGVYPRINPRHFIFWKNLLMVS